MPDQLVVVGAGQAGFQLAASLRLNGDRRRIMLVGDEKRLPYQRPPLSKKYLEAPLADEHLNLRAPAFFDEQRIEIMPGMRVVAIDRDAGRLYFEDGGSLGYDDLVLALGSRNRTLDIPGSDLEGVFQLRTIEDADRLRRALSSARKVAVVGAGFVGLEFAATALRRGAEVTVIEAAERPMARVLSVEMAELFRAGHAAAGARFVFGCLARQLVGSANRVEAIETMLGEMIEADLVMIGIGVVPNVDLAVQSGLAVEDGILVDEYLSTSDPSISGIGDCVRFPTRFGSGQPVRIESVQNAVEQAKTVAARLTGNPAPYTSLPWFWSDQGAMKLQIAGLSSPHDQTVAQVDANGATVYCFNESALVAVETLNRPGDHMAARQLLVSTPVLTPADVSRPGFALRAFAKALPAV